MRANERHSSPYRLRAKVALLSAFALLSPAAVHAALLGPAAEYNLFVLGNATLVNSLNSSNTDSGGNIAVAGAAGITAATLSNYSVASGIAGNPGANVNPARLVIGGNLTATNGGVGQGQNGAIYVDGTANLTSFTATGGINPGGKKAGDLVDFAAAKTLYQNASTRWGGIAANGNAANQFGTLTLVGSNTTLNVFNINAALLSTTNTVNINAPGASTVLINVSGAEAWFENGQVNLNNGLTEARVLYNFYEATKLHLVGSKNPNGSVLAPFAETDGGFGALDGQLITGSFNGHTAFRMTDGGRNTYFSGDLPPIAEVPLPAAAWLLMSGFALLAAYKKQRI